MLNKLPIIYHEILYMIIFSSKPWYSKEKVLIIYNNKILIIFLNLFAKQRRFILSKNGNRPSIDRSYF